MKIALKAANGLYVCAEGGGDAKGIVRANRSAIGPWETFEVIHEDSDGNRLPDGRIALKTSGGKFLAAENGGGQLLHANRDSIGPWEQWLVMVDKDGTPVPSSFAQAAITGQAVGLQSWDGHHFISMEVGSHDPLGVANRSWMQGWEQFQLTVVEVDAVPDAPEPIPGQPIPPTPPGAPAPGRKGVVVGAGRKFVDEGGAFLAVYTSMFWALWGWKHDRERTQKNLGYLRSEGVDAIRIFCEVDGSSWADRAVRPDWPDYEQQLGELIDYCYDTLGLRVSPTVIAGGTGIDQGLVARKVANVIRGREHKILLGEGANEAFKNLPDDNKLREVVRTLRQVNPQLLVAPSSPQDLGDPTAVKNFLISMGANIATGHFDRSTPPERQVRQTRDWWDLDVPGSQGEPAGWWSSVGEQRDPVHMAMQFAVGAMSGLAGYCAHIGPGIRGGGSYDVNRGIPANFYDVPNLGAVWQALRAVKALLPGDIVEWEKINGHWDWHPMPADYVWSDGFPRGVSRIYAARRGADFWLFPVAVKEHTYLWARQDTAIDIYSPLDGHLIASATLKGGHVDTITEADGRRWFRGPVQPNGQPEPGHAYVLKGPEQGGLWGYIIHGRT